MRPIELLKKMIARGGAKNRASGEEAVLARDEDGTPLRAREIAAWLVEEYRRRRAERLPLERQWALNASFYTGDQHAALNPESGETERLCPAHDYEEQGVYNRIAPLMETRLSSLRTLSYAMTVRPRTADAEDHEKGEIATRLLAYAQANGGFAEKKNEMLFLAELYGTAFLLSYWEADGETDGDLSYRVVSPFSVFPASLNKGTVEEQESILLADVMSCREVEDAFGVEVEGTDADVYTLAPVLGSPYGAPATLAFSGGQEKNCVTVLSYFERPSRRHEKGLYIIAAGDRVLWYSDLPYDDIPLVSFPSREMAGQFFGRSPIVDLIPLQRAYNGVKNKIHDYIRAVAANPLLVPEGAIPDIVEFSAGGLPPGEVVEYNAERGKPEPLSPAPLPAELRYECERLTAEMEYVAGVSQLMVTGKTPKGVTSGTAISNLREIDNSRLALTGENLRLAIRRTAIKWLGIYRRYASGARVLSVVGENDAGGALCFTAGDINSNDVVFDAENELKVSPEQQKQSFLTALQLGLFNDENGNLPRSVKSRAREMLEAGGAAADMMGCDELQIKAAERENAAVAAGRPPKIGIFDDHELHAEAHKKFLLQARYACLREKQPAVCEAFEEHIFMHLAYTKRGDAREEQKV
ncbi:MAG: hypothetical protein IJ012_05305 [Clostridia bacterium]|nr:hypothetical protein [Clostridia bacterium]